MSHRMLPAPRRALAALLLSLAVALPAEAGSPFPAHRAGSTPDLYRCASSEDCASGSYCVENGTDGQFFCKPSCSTDTDCSTITARFSGVGCKESRFSGGETSATRVCNEGPTRVRDYAHPSASSSAAAGGGLDLCRCLTEKGNSPYMRENGSACDAAISRRIGVADWQRVNFSTDAAANARWKELERECSVDVEACVIAEKTKRGCTAANVKDPGWGPQGCTSALVAAIKACEK